MADIIHRNYLLLPVLNRFEIQLGFGDMTVREICHEKQINPDFFLVILNSFHDPDYFPSEQLARFPLTMIVEYVRKSHSYYLDTKIPQIEELIDTLNGLASPELKEQLALIKKFFSEYKTEFITHIQEEEKSVYPYILQIDEAFTEHAIREEHIQTIRKNSISIYADRHDNLEDKLFDLKNILIKYLPPVGDSAVSNTLLIELFRLERDLNDHARIEDKILFPRVKQIEQEILKSVT
jgi:regulator of cell morphogenesis and NO signaling